MLEPVHPVKPVAPWVGGKRLLSKKLVKLIGSIEHDIYAEPFVGMGGVFFRRESRPGIEVINDFSSEVALLFRWLQRHYQQVLDALKWQICSREHFDRLISTDPSSLTELERVARFLYLQRTTFGGKVVNRSFGISRTGGARFDLTKLVPMLDAVHERLAGVLIECLDFRNFIRRYDTQKTLYYIDPPYFNSEHYYGHGMFAPSDFSSLAELLSSIKGLFIMSINDTPEMRSAFAGFKIDEVDVNYSISLKTKQSKELIISNF